MGPDLYRMSVDGFTDKFGHLLDPANEVITNTLPDHGLRLLDELAEPPHTLIHFDFRLDNLFFGDSGSATAVQMIDFQTVSRANPGYDLGYFLTQSLEPDVRRRHEDEFARRVPQRAGRRRGERLQHGTSPPALSMRRAVRLDHAGVRDGQPGHVQPSRHRDVERSHTPLPGCTG